MATIRRHAPSNVNYGNIKGVQSSLLDTHPTIEFLASDNQLNFFAAPSSGIPRPNVPIGLSSGSEMQRSWYSSALDQYPGRIRIVRPSKDHPESIYSRQIGTAGYPALSNDQVVHQHLGDLLAAGPWREASSVILSNAVRIDSCSRPDCCLEEYSPDRLSHLTGDVTLNIYASEYDQAVAVQLQGVPQTTHLRDCLFSAIQEFSNGVGDARPTKEIVFMAERIADEAFDKTIQPEITVDIDGALSFDLRLANGWLLLAEIDVYGTCDASVYDDREGKLLQRLPRATCEDLISMF